jgi:hypothetical protein
MLARMLPRDLPVTIAAKRPAADLAPQSPLRRSLGPSSISAYLSDQNNTFCKQFPSQAGADRYAPTCSSTTLTVDRLNRVPSRLHAILSMTRRC